MDSDELYCDSDELEMLKDDIFITKDNVVDNLDREDFENFVDFAPVYRKIMKREFTYMDLYMIQMYNQLYNQVYMVG